MKHNTLWICVFAVVLFLALTPMSQAKLGLEGIGGKVAFVSPDQGDSTVLLGVVANLGTIIPMLGAEASIDYWSQSYGVPGAETSFSSFTLNGTAKYRFPLPGAINPFAAGGLSIVRSSSDFEYTQPVGFPGIETSTSASDTDVGIHLGGGIDYALSALLNLTVAGRLAFGGFDTVQVIAALTYKLK